MRRGPLVLLATSLAAFTANLDNTVVAVALRDLQADLGSSVLGLQGVVTAYTVTLGALLLAGGAAADRFGARRVLITGLVLFGGASALCAASPSVGALVGWRALQGAGAALLLPAGLALLADHYPAGVRRRAVAVWAATGAAALVAGPVVGGELVAGHGWRSVFWVNVPLCLLVLALLVSPLPRRSSSSGRSQGAAGDDMTKITARVDLAGTVLVCCVLGAATYAVVLAGRHGLDARVLVALAVAAVAVLALARVESHATDPLLPHDVTRDRRFAGALLAGFAAALAAFVLMVFISLYLQLVTGHDARGAGHVLLPLPVALVATVALTRGVRVVRLPVLLGLAITGVALAGLAAALGPESGDRTVGLWLLLAGTGIGLTTAPAVSVALSVAGERRRGLASASVTAAREVGGVVAVAGLGALAVGRLTARLTSALVTARVPTPDRPALLDALLRADRPAVRRQLVDAVGPVQALKAYQGFEDAATQSFVSSTRWVLGAAALLLVLLAPLCAWLLRESSGRQVSARWSRARGRRRGRARPGRSPAGRRGRG